MGRIDTCLPHWASHHHPRVIHADFLPWWPVTRQPAQLPRARRPRADRPRPCARRSAHSPVESYPSGGHRSGKWGWKHTPHHPLAHLPPCRPRGGSLPGLRGEGLRCGCGHSQPPHARGSSLAAGTEEMGWGYMPGGPGYMPGGPGRVPGNGRRAGRARVVDEEVTTRHSVVMHSPDRFAQCAAATRVHTPPLRPSRYRPLASLSAAGSAPAASSTRRAFR